MGGYKNSITDIDNKIGIGVSSPAEKLDVAGTINAENSYKINGTNVIFVSATYTQLYTPEGAVTIYAGDSADRSNYYDNNQHIFRTAGGATERMRITSDGDIHFPKNNGTTLLSATDNFGNIALGAGDGGSGSIIEPHLFVKWGGNVGIGESNPVYALDVKDTGESWIRVNSSTATNDTGYRFAHAGTNHYVIGHNGTSDFLQFYNNTATREDMRIDSSGNVGIGTSSGKKNVFIDKALTIFSGANGTQSAIELVGNNTANTYISGVTFHNEQSTDTVAGKRIAQIYTVRDGADNAGAMVFDTHDTSTNLLERMRITSGGNVLVGTTGEPNGTSIYGSAFVPSSTDRSILKMATSNSSASTLAIFYNPNGQVGSIVTNGSATSYNTSSDYRLKENVVPMEGALDRVDALKPSRFNFIADPEKTVDGFLAHEVAEVIPEAITGEKDAVEEYEVTPAQYETVIIQEAVEATYDEEGNELTPAQEAITEQRLVSEAVMGTRPVYQGIDQSKIVPLLVGAIQELRAEIEALKANNSLT